jgi:hypothetical protein
MATTEPASGLDLVVCACGKEQYTVLDAIDAALFRGDLAGSWQKFLRAVAAENRAAELKLEVDQSAIYAAAETFRYQQDLITTEETEAWLANRALTADDFSDYFTRRHYASTAQENIVPENVEYPSASPELRRMFVADLILSGELDGMTTDLMWRLAARSAQAAPDPEAITAEERSFLERNGINQGQLANWLAKSGRNAAWFEEMLAIEAAYRKRCDTLLVPQVRQRELAVWQVLLTRVETEVIELDSREAAREARFCVREDEMSMEEVAAQGRYPYHRATFFLEGLPLDAQQRFLSVSAGSILEPTARGDGFELCRVINKIEPQADDPVVQSRIDQQILDRHFVELTKRYAERRLGSISTPAKPLHL